MEEKVEKNLGDVVMLSSHHQRRKIPRPLALKILLVDPKVPNLNHLNQSGNFELHRSQRSRLATRHQGDRRPPAGREEKN